MSYLGSKQHLCNLENARKSALKKKFKCRYCNTQIGTANIKKHETFCYLNPINLKLCVVCNKPIKAYKKNTTCSHSCSNKHFRTGPNNGSWKDDVYRTTCFHYHKKECVVCKEINIVEVHHLDEKHSNNDPSNLIPLCPTHHQYWHSRFKHLIEKQVLEYQKQWQMLRPD